MADKSQNDKNMGKDKDQNRDGEKNRGSQGGRSSRNQGDNQADSWVLDDESMDNQ